MCAMFRYLVVLLCLIKFSYTAPKQIARGNNPDRVNYFDSLSHDLELYPSCIVNKSELRSTNASNVLSPCNRQIPLNARSVSFVYDFELFLCMGVYDGLLRLCTAESKPNSASIEALLASQKNVNSSDICHRLQEIVVYENTGFTQTSEWVTMLNQNLRNYSVCDRACFDLNRDVNPLCSFIYEINLLWKHFQGRGTDSSKPEKLEEKYKSLNKSSPVVGYAKSAVPERKEITKTNSGVKKSSVLRKDNTHADSDPEKHMELQKKSMSDPTVHPDSGSNGKDSVAETQSTSDTMKPLNSKVKNDSVPSALVGAGSVNSLDSNGQSSVAEMQSTSDTMKPLNSKVKNDSVPSAQVGAGSVNSLDSNGQSSVAETQSTSDSANSLDPKGKSTVSDMQSISDPMKPLNSKEKNNSSARAGIGNKNDVKSEKDTTVNDNQPITDDAAPTQLKTTSTGFDETLDSSADQPPLVPPGAPAVEPPNIPIVSNAGDPLTGKTSAEQQSDPDNDGGFNLLNNGVPAEEEHNEVKPLVPNNPKTPPVKGDGGNFVDAENPQFFVYFMAMVVLCIIGYLAFHNKQKILALTLEGHSRRNSRRRRPNTTKYRKLDSNLEEAVTSSCKQSTTSIIY